MLYESMKQYLSNLKQELKTDFKPNSASDRGFQDGFKFALEMFESKLDELEIGNKNDGKEIICRRVR